MSGPAESQLSAERSPSRVVFHADALEWLRARAELSDASVITSMPDMSELPSLPHAEWADWFVAAAELVVSRVPIGGLAIFYQTDVKAQGRWIDKAQLVARGAERAGATLVFHKIVLRAEPGAVTRGLPAYSHLVAWAPGGAMHGAALQGDAAQGARLALGDASADVLPSAGATTWTRGMGVEACRAACHAVLHYTATRTVVDPFCGHGTVLAVANSLGLAAIGVELGARRARRARSLRMEDLEQAAELTESANVAQSTDLAESADFAELADDGAAGDAPK
jgi:hypothetical protein